MEGDSVAAVSRVESTCGGDPMGASSAAQEEPNAAGGEGQQEGESGERVGAQLLAWVEQLKAGKSAQFPVADSPSLMAGLNLGVCVVSLAWLFSCTPVSVWGNLPLALATVVCGLPFIAKRAGAPLQSVRRRLLRGQQLDDTSAGPAESLLDTQAWRRLVRAPPVEQAWDQFSAHIVREFVTDMWYCHVTDDREFPNEIQRTLNLAFGELAARAQHVDLASLLLRDSVDIVCEQLELYRVTRDSVGIEIGSGHCTRMAYDRALLSELAVDGSLHAALAALPESRTQAVRKLMDAATPLLLPASDAKSVLIRSLVRELLVNCVVGPILNLFKPPFLNRMLHSVLKDGVSQAAEAADASNAGAAPCSEGSTVHPPEHIEEEGCPTSDADLEGVIARRLDEVFGPETPCAGEGAEAAPSPPSPARGNPSVPSATAHAPALTHGLPRRQRQLVVAESQKLERAAQLAARRAVGGGGGDGGDVGEGKGAITEVVTSRLEEEDRHNEQALGSAAPSTAPQGDVTDHGRVEGAPGTSIDGAAGAGETTASSSELPVLPPPVGKLEAGRSVDEASTAAGVEAKATTPTAGKLWPAPPDSSSSAVSSSAAVPDAGRGGENGGQPSTSRLLRTHSRYMKNVKAKVIDAEVAAEGHVMYHIAVWDGHNPAWIVHRRFGKFEKLHLRIRDLQQRKVKLPPKRVLFHTLDEEFVRLRRDHLNRYLQAVLSDKNVAECHELWDFLSKDSRTYEEPWSGTGPWSLSTKLQSPNHGRADLENMSRLWEDVDIFNQRQRLGPPDNRPPPLSESQPQQEEGAITSKPTTASCETRLAPLEHPPEADAHAAGGDAGVTLASSPSSDRPSKLSSPERSAGDATEEPTHELKKGEQALAVEMATLSATGSAAQAVVRAEDEGRAAGADIRPSTSAGLLSEDNQSSQATSPQEEDKAQRTQWPMHGPSPAKTTPLMEGYELQNLSAPLHELVDTVFQLQCKGWLRRNIIEMARQIVDTWVGAAIDDLLASKLRTLSEPKTVAGLIAWLHGVLWPSGVFLTRDPPPVVDVEPEVIRALLLKRAKHPALTNLVGRAGVKRGVLDLFELLQSEVFMQQLGMKVVELVLVAWLPELQPLVHESHATPASE